MKVLILGGTGILSTDFTRKMARENNDVWVLNRGIREKRFEEEIHTIIGDLRNDDSTQLRDKIAFQKYDVIVDFLSFNVDQLSKTLNILQDICEQYVFISSATAYIKSESETISEYTNSVGNKNWEYSYNKSLCEEYLKKQNINYTIVRPYVTFGQTRIPFQIIPDNCYYSLLARIINDKPVILLNSGSAICTLTYTIDFANVLAKLLLNTNAYKEVFHITSNCQQEWREVYKELCVILGKQEHLISVALEDIRTYLPSYYNMLRGDKGTSWKFDNSKVLKAVGGYNFQYDLQRGLRESVQYFLSHEELQKINYRWDAEVDFLIKRVAPNWKGKLSIINSKLCTSKDFRVYRLFTNSIYNYLFHLLWRIKHRDELRE